MIRVSARGLGKQYKLYARPWHRALEWATLDRHQAHRPHWALRDVGFEAAAGEALGIIGLNGAGKSTLLKILAGTTQPTTGSLRVEGRVAALLELGLGMHPDFSGWENARLLCQLLGLEPAAIEARLPEIREFSELGEYMDQPLRTYSTGMQVRLAFSAVTAVRPDVLIVDEALSVGDAYFQHKSMRRVLAFKEAGSTLLLVTHDAAALKAVCARALLLDGGRLLQDGDVDAVFDFYNALVGRKMIAYDIEQRRDEIGRIETRSGTREAEIESVELSDAAGLPRRAFRSGETARVEYRIAIHRAMEAPTAGFVIRDRFGRDVFGTNTFHLGVEPATCEAGERLSVSFEITLDLGCGGYSLSGALHRGADHIEANFDWWDRMIVFEVVPGAAPTSVGVAALSVRARRCVLS